MQPLEKFYVCPCCSLELKPKEVRYSFVGYGYCPVCGDNISLTKDSRYR